MAEVEAQLAELLKTFTPEQIDFVSHRMVCKSDKEAAEKAELNYDSVRSWKNKQEVNLAVRLAKMDSVVVAREKLRRLAPKAVDVLDEELDDKENRLAAARDVLDRAGLAKESKIKHTGQSAVVLTWGDGDAGDTSEPA